jgi:nitroimidazol reductase NimA-like FMN-containing flavoprotein (pyridoxamine 5'-phosphate oxidase superfamily)
MSEQERQAFLADLHVGVLSIPRDAGSPLSAPIWYSYEPGGDIRVLLGPQSLKAKLLSEGTAVTLVAQQEAMPYAYVSVEGVVSEICAGDEDRDLLPMAIRYLGEELGKGYADANAGNPQLRVSITPQRWLSVDYAKTMG